MIDLSPVTLTILMFVGLLIGLFLGHPLAFVLGGLAVIFGLIGWGPQCLYMFMNRIYNVMDNYVLIAIPLFIFMANILERSGVAEKLFDSFRLLLGPLRGGVAVAVVIVCTLFAACTGIIGASVVSMSLLAMPTMLKYGYQKELTTGTIAAGGTLGILIPPSIMLVVMGDQARLSVGKLFIGAVLPGLVLAALYIIYILLRCLINPKLGPALSPEERKMYSLITRVSQSVKYLVPPMILILGVLGSIFFGVATPTEAAAVGAFLAFVMMLVYRRFSWKAITEAIWQTAKTNCMVIIILCGATCFTGVFLGIGGGDVIKDLLFGLGLGKWGIFWIMMLIVFILGMFIDWIGIVLITFPVFLPIARQLGFDPLWFVIMIAINLQASFLTPPFGYALFYLKGTAPEGVTIMDIYKGIIPFVFLMICGLLICVIFPSLSLWLPSLMVR